MHTCIEVLHTNTTQYQKLQIVAARMSEPLFGRAIRVLEAAVEIRLFSRIYIVLNEETIEIFHVNHPFVFLSPVICPR